MWESGFVLTFDTHHFLFSNFAAFSNDGNSVLSPFSLSQALVRNWSSMFLKRTGFPADCDCSQISAETGHTTAERFGTPRRLQSLKVSDSFFRV